MSRVPGTFKDSPRVPRRDLSPEGTRAEALLLEIGALRAERWLVRECSVMCAKEIFGGGVRWHVSVAHPSRYPTWDELKTAAWGIPSIQLEAGRTFAQLIGNPIGTGEYVNVHDNCFHLYEIDDPWRAA